MSKTIFFRETSPFGAMDTPLRSNPHTGIDVATYTGTPLPSVSEGEVVRVLNDASCGIGLKVRNGDTDVIYCHLSEVHVKVGEKVGLGEIIGKTGNTGNSSGPHLHLAAKENGQYVDPREYIDMLQSLARKILDPDWATAMFSAVFKFII